MLDASLTLTAPAPAAAPAPAPKAQPGFFHELLSELNPLQYVPVVGTIYRAITGDTIPEEARFAGSLVVSGLTGGPVGVAINAGTTFLEHMLGIDPEKIAGALLADIGIGPSKPSAGPSKAPTSAGPTSAGPSATAVTPGKAAVSAQGAAPGEPKGASKAGNLLTGGAWSPSQLAAYGISQGPLGVLRRGNEAGSDVLNGLELAQIHAQAAVNPGALAAGSFSGVGLLGLAPPLTPALSR